MSSTRYAEIAAVLASHGDRAGTELNSALIYVADLVKSLTGLRLVTGGVLKGEPNLEEALSLARHSGARKILVHPLFMSDGYFTEKVLPDRIRKSGFEDSCQCMTPLGLDPGLPALIVTDAMAALARAQFVPSETRLLLVGHGSKLGPASANATRAAAESVARHGNFNRVETAFLEEAPFLEDALQAEAGPTIVAGFFFGEGMHAGEDVPVAIRETGSSAVYSGPVGRSSGVPQLIAAAIHAEIRARAH
jgi:sirohydrochlorin ferrochelatase